MMLRIKSSRGLSNFPLTLLELEASQAILVAPSGSPTRIFEARMHAWLMVSSSSLSWTATRGPVVASRHLPNIACSLAELVPYLRLLRPEYCERRYESSTSAAINLFRDDFEGARIVANRTDAISREPGTSGRDIDTTADVRLFIMHVERHCHRKDEPKLPLQDELVQVTEAFQTYFGNAEEIVVHLMSDESYFEMKLSRALRYELNNHLHNILHWQHSAWNRLEPTLGHALSDLVPGFVSRTATGKSMNVMRSFANSRVVAGNDFALQSLNPQGVEQGSLFI